MVTTQQREQHNDMAQHKGEILNALLEEEVIHTLGQPGDLLKVQVRQLWEGHYRVNVFVGADAASARVAHSYFVIADANGNIIKSNPQITRQY